MLITNFQGGEISPALFGRIDLPVYTAAVSKLVNFSPLATGGITRRQGLKRQGTLKGQCRLIPFIVNDSLSFIFEIGSEYIRIWKNGELLYIYAHPLEFISTPDFPLYQLSELEEIQYAQTHDSLYITHYNHKPTRIIWQGGESFTLETLTITGNAHQVPFQEPDEYPACVSFFLGRLIFARTLKNPQKIWASKVFDYTNFSTFDTVVSRTKQLKEPDLHVFSCTTTEGSATITALTKDLTGVAHIEDYYITGHKGIPAKTKVVSVTSDTMTLSNAVTASKVDMVLSIHTWVRPESPQAEDYETKEIINNVTTPAHSFSFEIASDKNDAIKWLAPAKDLIIGTESAEWIMPNGVTACNVQVTLNSRYGVAAYQAALAGKTVVFIGSDGKTLKSYLYDFQSANYAALDLTENASHLLESSRAVDFDHDATGNLIYVTRKDGIVLRLYFDEQKGVRAWSRIITGGSGKIKNTVVATDQNGCKSAFFSVERDGTFYLEQLGTDETDAVYLDSYTEYTQDTDITAYPDAAVFIPETAEIFPLVALPDTYKDFSKKMYIGYEYESVIESLPVIKDGRNSKKRIVSLLIRFLSSCIPEVSQIGFTEEKPNQAEPFSGVIAVPVQSGYERDVLFRLNTAKPAGCTVLAVNSELD